MMTKEATIIMGAALRIRIGKQCELAERMGLLPQTLSYQLKDPGAMPLRTLRKYVKTTAMRDDEIIALVRGQEC